MVICGAGNADKCYSYSTVLRQLKTFNIKHPDKGSNDMTNSPLVNIYEIRDCFY